MNVQQRQNLLAGCKFLCTLNDDEQITGSISQRRRTGQHYSSLGGLLEFYRQTTDKGKWVERNDFYYFYHPHEYSGDAYTTEIGMPPPIADWYGLHKTNINQIAIFNDAGWTFLQIAEWIKVILCEEPLDL